MVCLLSFPFFAFVNDLKIILFVVRVCRQMGCMMYYRAKQSEYASTSVIAYNNKQEITVIFLRVYVRAKCVFFMGGKMNGNKKMNINILNGV